MTPPRPVQPRQGPAAALPGHSVDPDLARGLHILADSVGALPWFRSRPSTTAAVRQLLERQAVAAGTRTVTFAFDTMAGVFVTGSGIWNPNPRAFAWATMIFCAAHCRGPVPVFARTYAAAHGALDRQVESLARTDLPLANLMAFGHGDTPGLHLHRDRRHASVFQLRWSPPPGVRIASPATVPRL
jgi:hypothetical protein